MTSENETEPRTKIDTAIIKTIEDFLGCDLDDLPGGTDYGLEDFKKALEANGLVVVPREVSDKAMATVAFYASVIKGGEPWSQTCQDAYEVLFPAKEKAASSGETEAA